MTYCMNVSLGRLASLTLSGELFWWTVWHFCKTQPPNTSPTFFYLWLYYLLFPHFFSRDSYYLHLSFSTFFFFLYFSLFISFSLFLSFLSPSVCFFVYLSQYLWIFFLFLNMYGAIFVVLKVYLTLALVSLSNYHFTSLL